MRDNKQPVTLRPDERDTIIDTMIDAMAALQQIETEAKEKREALEVVSNILFNK